MATTRKGAPAAPGGIKRPVFGQERGLAGAAQAPDPYGSQPSPGGPAYPWSPGGTSKEVGTPDNWADYYPTEGHGRGDAWIGVKFGPGGKFDRAQDNVYSTQRGEVRPPGEPDFTSARDRMSPEDFAAYQQGALPQNQAAKDALAAMHDPSNDTYVSGAVRAAQSKKPLLNALKKHGVQPGWLNNIGGGKGSGGYFDGKQVLKPGDPGYPAGGPGTTGTTPPGTAAAAPGAKLGRAQVGAENQAAITAAFKGKPKGTTLTVNGRKVLLNDNGALVDVTDPKNRQRLTNRQGQYAAPTAPAGAPAATQPPPTQAPPGQVQQQQDQLMPYRQPMGYSGGYGPGMWNDPGGFYRGGRPMYSPGGLAGLFSGYGGMPGGMGQGMSAYGNPMINPFGLY